MLKIIHSADWHLRDMQFGKTSRAQDFTDSVYRIVDVAVKEGADYILCAGDILHSKKPSSKNIGDLLELNRRLLAADVTLLVVTGNHDKCNPSWIKVLQQELSSNGKSCGIYDIDHTLFTMKPKGEGKDITVYGLPDMAPDDFRAASPEFPDADILMLHGLVKDFAAFDAGDRALTIEDLPCNRYKAILLGDIHTHAYKTVDNCTVGYPGSTELCSRQESPDKYVSLFTFQDDGTVDRTSLPIRLNRPIVIKDVRTRDEADLLLKDITALKKQHPTLLIRKDPEMTDLYARIVSVVDARECVIRVSNIPSEGFKLMNLVNRAKNDPGNKLPEDFVADYFSANTSCFAMAQALCDREAKPAQIIETFIDTTLYANKEVNDQKFG